MDDITIKYNKLSRSRKQELNDFLDSLLSRQKNDNSNQLALYKKKILGVSVWSAEDCKAFEENQKAFRQWKVQEW